MDFDQILEGKLGAHLVLDFNPLENSYSMFLHPTILSFFTLSIRYSLHPSLTLFILHVLFPSFIHPFYPSRIFSILHSPFTSFIHPLIFFPLTFVFWPTSSLLYLSWPSILPSLSNHSMPHSPLLASFIYQRAQTSLSPTYRVVALHSIIPSNLGIIWVASQTMDYNVSTFNHPVRLLCTNMS